MRNQEKRLAHFTSLEPQRLKNELCEVCGAITHIIKGMVNLTNAQKEGKL